MRKLAYGAIGLKIVRLSCRGAEKPRWDAEGACVNRQPVNHTFCRHL